MKHLARLLLAAALLLVGGCATNPVSGDKDFVLMSEDQEIALGRKYHAQVLEAYGEYDDPGLAAYVQRIGRDLARHSHRPGLVYRFTVVDGPEVNAFALPGGYIYISRGLLAYLNSEAELAAVLGHEIGHVTARHSVRQHSASTATGLLGAVVAAGTGVRGAQDVANVVGTALVRGYGREHELESDRLGAEYLARSGYDPRAMLRVIRLLKHQERFEIERARAEGREPRVYHGLFSTHPDNDRRLQEVVTAADRYRQDGYRDDREAYLRRVDGLAFGPSADEGVVRDHRFYHAGLGFTLAFPEGWEIDNRPDRLVATPPGRDGWIRLTVQDINRRISPREFMLQRLGLANLRHGEAIHHRGMRGYTAVAPAKTPFGRRPVRVTVLYLDDRAYILAAAAKDADKPYLYDPQALATARSLRRLEAGERELAQPHRIGVRTAGRGDSYARLARRSPLSEAAAEQLRLLNADYPDGRLRPGELIKVVE